MKAQPLLYYDSYLLKFWLHNLKKSHYSVRQEYISWLHSQISSEVDIFNSTQSFSLNYESNQQILFNKSLILFSFQNDLFTDACLQKLKVQFLVYYESYFLLFLLHDLKNGINNQFWSWHFEIHLSRLVEIVNWINRIFSLNTLIWFTV